MAHLLQPLLVVWLGAQEELFRPARALEPELQASSVELRRYVADRLGELMTHPDFEYAVQSAALGDAGREALLFERLDLAIGSLR